MIEKLKNIPVDMNGNLSPVWCKINELVDAANEYEKDREEIKEWIAIVSDLRSRVPVVESRVSILEEHAHPTAETPADPYTEQRKWIGKVCRFFDSDKDDARIGVLSAIQNGMYFIKHTSTAYDYCEPVKLDSDIIYKGGDND